MRGETGPPISRVSEKLALIGFGWFPYDRSERPALVLSRTHRCGSPTWNRSSPAEVAVVRGRPTPSTPVRSTGTGGRRGVGGGWSSSARCCARSGRADPSRPNRCRRAPARPRPTRRPRRCSAPLRAAVRGRRSATGPGSANPAPTSLSGESGRNAAGDRPGGRGAPTLPGRETGRGPTAPPVRTSGNGGSPVEEAPRARPGRRRRVPVPIIPGLLRLEEPVAGKSARLEGLARFHHRRNPRRTARGPGGGGRPGAALSRSRPEGGAYVLSGPRTG